MTKQTKKGKRRGRKPTGLPHRRPLTFRARPDEAELIHAVATSYGMTTSGFVASASLEKAAELISIGLDGPSMPQHRKLPTPDELRKLAEAAGVKVPAPAKAAP